jgi:hypothetical protein
LPPFIAPDPEFDAPYPPPALTIPGEAKGEGEEPPTIEELNPTEPLLAGPGVVLVSPGPPAPTVMVNVAPTETD